MKQISNHALLSLLVVSIVVSVVGTVSNLNKINQLVEGSSSAASGISGFATTGTGNVNISIASTASISMTDSTIDFGACSPNSTGSNISSNDSTVESWGQLGICTVLGDATPNVNDNFTITNDGNADVNISIQINATASQFIGGGDPQIYFMARNGSDRPGCHNVSQETGNFSLNDTPSQKRGLQWPFRQFLAANTEYPVCINLTYNDSFDRIAVFMKLSLPSDAPSVGPKLALLTFTATSI
jgi:hypothetical protein